MTALKNENELLYSSFAANYKHELDPQYPYLLALSLARSTGQFQETRAMKMLGDWVCQYDKLSQVMKYKYAHFIPKILKILVTKYQGRAPIQYCLARFFVVFYQVWKDMNALIVQNLQKSDVYSLHLVWYICHILMQVMNTQKIVVLNQFLSNKFQKGLRQFKFESYVQVRLILKTIYFINIYGCKKEFEQNTINWSKKFGQFEGLPQQKFRLNVLIKIVYNRNILILGKQPFAYWMQKVVGVLQILQNKAAIMDGGNHSDQRVLDLFLWMLQCKQVQQLLCDQQDRYLGTILSNIKPNQNNLKHIFHLPKYRQIGTIMYEIIFKSNPQSVQLKMQAMLQKYINHSFSILSQKSNYVFLDCLCEQKVKLGASVIINIIKSLGNNHIRRMLPGKVLTILAKLIAAATSEYTLTDEMLGLCLKAFKQTIVYKMADESVGELRLATCRMFLELMKVNIWQDHSKNEYIFSVCEQYTTNTAEINPVVIDLLYLLITKFGFSSQIRVQALLSDIFLKVYMNQTFIGSFIGLIVTATLRLKLLKTKRFIQIICQKNPSPKAIFFAFQASNLMSSNKNNNTEAGFQTVTQMFISAKEWDDNFVDINLMMLEIYFLKLKPQEALSRVQQIDQQLTAVIQSLYEEGNYRLLCLICAKVLPSVGGQPSDLQKLESYKWLRKMSFDMLARSFYKSTSVSVCYAFSQIVLRSERPFATLRWLSQQQFFDYLFQGLNDFLSKQKVFTLQIATSLLLIRLLNSYPLLLPPSSHLLQFVTLKKNEIWWTQAGSVINFSGFKDSQSSRQLILPQFKSFYESQINMFFKDYFKAHEDSKARLKQKQKAFEQDDE